MTDKIYVSAQRWASRSHRRRGTYLADSRISTSVRTGPLTSAVSSGTAHGCARDVPESPKGYPIDPENNKFILESSNDEGKTWQTVVRRDHRQKRRQLRRDHRICRWHPALAAGPLRRRWVPFATRLRFLVQGRRQAHGPDPTRSVRVTEPDVIQCQVGQAAWPSVRQQPPDSRREHLESAAKELYRLALLADDISTDAISRR